MELRLSPQGRAPPQAPWWSIAPRLQVICVLGSLQLPALCLPVRSSTLSFPSVPGCAVFGRLLQGSLLSQFPGPNPAICKALLQSSIAMSPFTRRPIPSLSWAAFPGFLRGPWQEGPQYLCLHRVRETEGWSRDRTCRHLLECGLQCLSERAFSFQQPRQREALGVWTACPWDWSRTSCWGRCREKKVCPSEGT